MQFCTSTIAKTNAKTITVIIVFVLPGGWLSLHVDCANIIPSYVDRFTALLSCPLHVFCD